jgi:hypothetical protein
MGYVDLYPTLYLAFEVMTIRLTKRHEPCVYVGVALSFHV